MDRENAAQRHRQLNGEGWEWRFSGDAKQVSSLEETYASLGMETLVEHGVLGRDADCGSCFEGEGLDFGYETLYTRGQAVESGRFDDDLFDA